MSVFPREVYLHSDPANTYDCINWDPKTRLYCLRGPGGEVRAESHEFTPVSLAHEELLQYTANGQLITVADQCETGAGFAFIRERPTERSAGTAQPDPRPRARAASGGPAEGHDEARAQAQQLLAGADGRGELAERASGVLGESAQTLIEKYAHLDNGRFRMVLGNRLTSKIRQGETK